MVLTGGGVGIAMLEAVGRAAGRDDVDWSAVEVFWGDERFVAAGDPDRNDRQAREALLDALGLDPARVHPMPPADGEQGDDPDAAADVYAQVLADAAGRLGTEPGVPTFDVLRPGAGRRATRCRCSRTRPRCTRGAPGVVAVRDCPKPPPTRVSLTLPAARCAAGVAGRHRGVEGRGARARAAVAGSRCRRAAGRSGTLWLLDREAAARL